MAITEILEESEMIDAGAPSIKYEGERPLKKQEMLMAGPDWYIKRIELLMDEYGYGYEEAGEIAYDSDKYYDKVGYEPGMKKGGKVIKIMPEGVLYKGKAKDYPGITKIIKKNKLKIIPINIGPGKKKK